VQVQGADPANAGFFHGLEVWEAPSTGALTAKVITVTMTGNVDDAAISCFAINGNFSLASPFDPNGSLPNSGSGVTRTYSTNNSNDLAICAFGQSDGGLTAWPGLPSGFTQIHNVENNGGSKFAYLLTAFMSLSSPQAGTTVTNTVAAAPTHLIGMVDAFTADGSAAFAPAYAQPRAQALRALSYDNEEPDNLPSRLVRARQQSSLFPQPPPIIPPTPMAMARRSGSDEFDEYWRWASRQLPLRAQQALPPSGVSISKLIALPATTPPLLAFSKLDVLATTIPPTHLAISKLLTLVTISQSEGGGPIPVFPNIPVGFPVKVKPNFKTTIGTASSGREVRGANQILVALWEIDLLFEELRDQTQNQTPNAFFAGFTQFMQLCQLWLSLYGQFGLFYFTAPWDESRLLQFIANGDGQTVKFTAIRTWGIGAAQITEPVGGINTIIEVRVDNVIINPLVYSASGNELVFQTAPAPGSVITMTFTYYYLCRFVEDKQDFEEFMQDRWTLKSLKFRSVYWPNFG
jgi:hypothetical protein